jgi:hypothetical protein
LRQILKQSVELVFRRCFRIIRSVKFSSLADYSVETPELCAVLFTSSFGKLSCDLLEHHSMMMHDAHYRVQLTRKNEFQAKNRHETVVVPKVEKQSVKFAGDIKEEKGTPSPSKICSGHLGKQLSAVRKDGRACTCGYDKNCTFAHVSIAGKSDERSREITNTMPSPIKSGMVRAINLPKK